jgi:ATP-dependent Zn protease
MRRQALQGGMATTPAAPQSIHDVNFYGPNGALTASGDVIIESQAWRERLFAQRAEREITGYAAFTQRAGEAVRRLYPGFGMGGGGGQALNQLLVVMDGIDEPPVMKKFMTNRVNTFLDAIFIVPRKVRGVSLRLKPARPRQEQIHFIGACNVPIEVLDPALTRPGRMGRHIWFRTPTKDDRLDILDLYLGKVDHEPDLDTGRRRDELARITSGYSPSMIEQCCSMALTIAHTEGRRRFGWEDIVEAMTTVETGTAQNIEYIPQETRAVAIHEAGHAATGHIYLEKDVLSTRLSIRKRGGSLGHYQSMEKDERFSHFRSRLMGGLIMTLGAMAAEHVFYGENTEGVAGDVQSATNTAALMVGWCAMGPEPVHLTGSVNVQEDTEEVLKRLERIGSTIMSRSRTSAGMVPDSVGSVLSDRDKRRMAAQILGQAYVTAYSLIAYNREGVEQIADTLIERKEMHGDEVVDLLNSVGLRRPEIDLLDDRTWPTV